MSYVPPHRRGGQQKASSSSSSPASSPRKEPRFAAAFQQAGRRQTTQQQQQRRCIFFGDSFVRMFTLIPNKAVKVNAFKGASAKGLTKMDNSNRLEIERTVARNHHNNGTDFVFCFGSVDVHHSWYYKKYHKKDKDIDTFLPRLAADYVEFVGSLKASATILGVFPSPLNQENVRESLELYGVLTAEEGQEVLDGDITLQARQDRVRTFNAALAEHCKELGVTFLDPVNDVLEPGDNNTINPIYIDVSVMNIHLVWETTILMWLKKWPTLNSYVEDGFKDELEKSFQAYLETKPWATKSGGEQASFIKEQYNP